MKALQPMLRLAPMPAFNSVGSTSFYRLSSSSLQKHRNLCTKPSSPQTISNTAAPFSHCTRATIKIYFPFHYSCTTLVINGASVMRITYVHVWMRLIRIESKFAGFTFNALLNLHLCRQALSFLCLD